MSDIFISYASEERDRVQPLISALEKRDGPFSGIEPFRQGRLGGRSLVPRSGLVVPCWLSGARTQSHRNGCLKKPRQASAGKFYSGLTRQCRAAIRLRQYSSRESDGLERRQFISNFYPPGCGYYYHPRSGPGGSEGGGKRRRSDAEAQRRADEEGLREQERQRSEEAARRESQRPIEQEANRAGLLGEERIPPKLNERRLHLQRNDRRRRFLDVPDVGTEDDFMPAERLSLSSAWPWRFGSLVHSVAKVPM